MSVNETVNVRKNVTVGARSAGSFLLLWVLPVLGYILVCHALVGDTRDGPAVRSFLESVNLLYVTLGFFALCFLLERLAPYRSDWNRLTRSEANDWGLYFLAIVPAEAFARALLFAGVPWILMHLPVSPFYSFWPHGWPLWLQVVLGLMLFDLTYYWYHRLSHTNRWMWAWHRLHHASEYLVTSKGFRHTFIEWAMDIILHTTVFALAGMPPVVIFWLYVITNPIGILSHGNIAIPNLAGLGHVINLPRTHLIHHDRDLRGGMKNFSAFTMVWDHVFGTFVSPALYCPERLGVAGYSVPENLWHLWLSFLPTKIQTETRSVEASSSSSLNPNRRGSLSRST